MQVCALLLLLIYDDRSVIAPAVRVIASADHSCIVDKRDPANEELVKGGHLSVDCHVANFESDRCNRWKYFWRKHCFYRLQPPSVSTAYPDMSDAFSTPAEHALIHPELGDLQPEAGPSSMGDAAGNDLEQAYEVEETVQIILQGGYKTVSRPAALPYLILSRVMESRC